MLLYGCEGQWATVGPLFPSVKQVQGFIDIEVNIDQILVSQIKK